MIIFCKHCGQKYEIDNKYAGSEVQCQKCGESFIASELENKTAFNNQNLALHDTKFKKPLLCWILDILGGVMLGIGVILFFLCFSHIDTSTPPAIWIGIAVSGCLFVGFSCIVNYTGQSAFYARKIFELIQTKK